MTWAARAWTGEGPWRKVLSLAAPLLVAVIPKCPVCLAAHASIAGAIGVGEVAARTWVPYAAALSLILALALLGYGAQSRRGRGPLMLGLVAAALIAIELFHEHPPTALHGHAPVAPEPHAQLVTWIGVALLVAASLWNAWPKRERAMGAVGGGCTHSHC